MCINRLNHKKEITSALVLIDADGGILGCHGTGKPDNQGYDFPKGIMEDGEWLFETALREFKEETGVELSDLLPDDVTPIYDCGIHKHNNKKNISIFVCEINKFPDLSLFKCKSFFNCDGKDIPEVDGYKVIGKEDRKMFNKVLWNKFEIIDRHKEYRSFFYSTLDKEHLKDIFL